MKQLSILVKIIILLTLIIIPQTGEAYFITQQNVLTKGKKQKQKQSTFIEDKKQNAEDFAKLVVQVGHTDPIRSAAFSPNGNYIATAGLGGIVKIWDRESSREIKTFKESSGLLGSMEISHDANYVAIGSQTGGVEVWNILSSQKIASFDCPMGFLQCGTSLAFSPDDKFVASGGFSTLGIWEKTTSKKIVTFAYPKSTEQTLEALNPIMSLTYSPDGNELLSGDFRGKIILWDIKSGEKLNEFAIDLSTRKVFFYNNEIVGALGNETIKLWNKKTGDELNNIQPPDGKNKLIDFLPNLSSIALVEENNQISIWSLPKERKKFDETLSIKTNSLAELDKITFLVFSKDGTHLLVGDNKGTTVQIKCKTATIEKIFSSETLPILKVAFSGDSNVSVEARSDSSIEELNKPVEYEIGKVNKSIDKPLQTTILSTSWNLIKGIQKNHAKTEEFIGENPYPLDQICSEFSDKILEKDLYFNLKKLEGERIDNKNASNLYVYEKCISQLGISPSQEKNLGLEEIKQLMISGKFSHAAKMLKKIAKSYNITQQSNTINEIIRRDEAFRGYFEFFTSVAKKVDNATGKVAVSHDRLKIAKTLPGQIELINFKKTFSTIANLYDPETITNQAEFIAFVFKKAQELEMFFDVPNAETTSLVFSPDSSLLISLDPLGVFNIWNTETGDQQAKFKVENLVNVLELAFSSSNHSTIMTISGDGSVNIFNWSQLKDAKNLVEKAIINFKTNVDKIKNLTDFHLSKDNRLLIAGFLDGKTKIFDTSTGKELCTLISFINRDWVVVLPDGRFDTNNPDSLKGLCWIAQDEPMRPLPLEIFFRDYYEPGLLTRILKGDKFKPTRSLSELNRIQPIVQITKVAPDPQVGNIVLVTVQVTSVKGFVNQKGKQIASESGIQDIKLFRDGQLVKYIDGNINVNKESYFIKTFSVQVPNNNNHTTTTFTAYAFNQDRVKSITSLPMSYSLLSSSHSTHSTRPKAYVITMGVGANRLEDPPPLISPPHSVKKIESLLSKKLASSYDVIPIQLLSTFEEGSSRVELEQATKLNLKTVFDLLSGKEVSAVQQLEVNKEGQIRHTKPDDVVILFVSSHGYRSNGEFYIIPYIREKYNINKESKLFSEKCISSKDLSLWWKDIDAGQMVMILDSCYSGAVTGDNFRPGPLGDRNFGQLSYDKAMFILCASQPNEIVRADPTGSPLTQAILEIAEKNLSLNLIESFEQVEKYLPPEKQSPVVFNFFTKKLNK